MQEWARFTFTKWVKQIPLVRLNSKQNHCVPVVQNYCFCRTFHWGSVGQRAIHNTGYSRIHIYGYVSILISTRQNLPEHVHFHSAQQHESVLAVESVPCTTIKTTTTKYVQRQLNFIQPTSINASNIQVINPEISLIKAHKSTCSVRLIWIIEYVGLCLFTTKVE